MVSQDPSAVEKRIELLLEEYRSLRSEIANRINSRMTLLGFLTASVALVVGDKGRPWWVWSLMIALLLFGAAVWAWSGRLIGKLSKRVAKLEHDINELAQKAYAAPPPGPLQWENETRDKRRPLLRVFMP